VRKLLGIDLLKIRIQVYAQDLQEISPDCRFYKSILFLQPLELTSRQTLNEVIGKRYLLPVECQCRKSCESGVMKTVAIIGTRGYPSFYGGFETAVRNLVPFLTQNNLKVRVYCRAGETTEFSYSNQVLVERVFTRGFNNVSLSTLSHGLHACIHALFHKPDVALVMNVANGFWIPLLRLRRIPVVVNVDGMEWKRDKWNRIGKSIFYIGALITSKTSNKLIADSICIQEHWSAQFGVKSTFIPYGGVFSSSDFSERENFILYVARLVPENSVFEFLESISMINVQTKVVIVGAKSSFPAIQAKLEEVLSSNLDVVWLGRINDEEKLNSLWNKCALYFHGHTVGGTNPALVQAMSSGAPIVAVDSVFNREVLQDAGTFVSRDPVSIANTISSYINNKKSRENHSIKARKRAQTHYNWDFVNKRYFELIIEAIEDCPIEKYSRQI